MFGHGKTPQRQVLKHRNRPGHDRPEGVDVAEDTVEHWRSVVGYEGSYEISDQGRLRSRMRAKNRRADAGWRLLTPGVGAKGYRRYVLISPDGSKRNWPEHHLVLTAFVGPRPEGLECCHNNGNPSDNRLSNLRWDTPLANRIDRKRHGHDSTGVHRTDRCRAGHPRSAENTRIYFKNGYMCQKCRPCHRAWEAARRTPEASARIPLGGGRS